MKKIILFFAAFVLILNANAEGSVEISPAVSYDFPKRTILMGEHGESKIYEDEFTYTYTISNSEPINIKRQIYVEATDYLRGLLFGNSETNTESVVANTEDIIEKISSGLLIPIVESEIKHLEPGIENAVSFSWDSKANVSGIEGFSMDNAYSACYHIIRNADTDEILYTDDGNDAGYPLQFSWNAGIDAQDTGNGIITLSQWIAVNRPVRVHYFLISDDICTEFFSWVDFNRGFNGIYEFYEFECWYNTIAAYKRDVVITKPYEYTEIEWNITKPNGMPFTEGGQYYWIFIYEAIDEEGNTIPTLPKGNNLGDVARSRINIPQATGTYTGPIIPYDVNGPIISAINETQENAGVVAGYYSILGQKLPQEPQSGVYMIRYENGRVVKVVK